MNHASRQLLLNAANHRAALLAWRMLGALAIIALLWAVIELWPLLGALPDQGRCAWRRRRIDRALRADRHSRALLAAHYRKDFTR